MYKYILTANSITTDGSSGVYNIGVYDNFVDAEISMINALQDEYINTDGKKYGGDIEHTIGSCNGSYNNSIGNLLELKIDKKEVITSSSAEDLVWFHHRAFPIAKLKVNEKILTCSVMSLKEELKNKDERFIEDKLEEKIISEINFYFDDVTFKNSTREQLINIISENNSNGLICVPNNKKNIKMENKKNIELENLKRQINLINSISSTLNIESKISVDEDTNDEEINVLLKKLLIDLDERFSDMNVNYYESIMFAHSRIPSGEFNMITTIISYEDDKLYYVGRFRDNKEHKYVVTNLMRNFITNDFSTNSIFLNKRDVSNKEQDDKTIYYPLSTELFERLFIVKNGDFNATMAILKAFQRYNCNEVSITKSK